MIFNKHTGQEAYGRSRQEEVKNGYQANKSQTEVFNSRSSPVILRIIYIFTVIEPSSPAERRAQTAALHLFGETWERALFDVSKQNTGIHFDAWQPNFPLWQEFEWCEVSACIWQLICQSLRLVVGIVLSLCTHAHPPPDLSGGNILSARGLHFQPDTHTQYDSWKETMTTDSVFNLVYFSHMSTQWFIHSGFWPLTRLLCFVRLCNPCVRGHASLSSKHKVAQRWMLMFQSFLYQKDNFLFNIMW